MEDEFENIIQDFSIKVRELRLKEDSITNKTIKSLENENEDLKLEINSLINKLSLLELRNDTITLEEYKIKCLSLENKIMSQTGIIEDLEYQINMYECEENKNKSSLQTYIKLSEIDKEIMFKNLLNENGTLRDKNKRYIHLEEDFKKLEYKLLNK